MIIPMKNKLNAKNKSYRFFSGVVIALLFVMAGCIKNDIPYPRIQQSITSISAEGEIKEALIDSVNLRATVYLDETVDIESVKFTSFTVSPGAEVYPNLLEGVYNLKKPVVVNVSLYQDYQWTVSAEQHIERYFTIAGQIGETVIDEPGHRIIVRVPMTENLRHLDVTSIKLGPAGLTTMTPEIGPGEYNFERPVRVAVTAFGRTEDWTIYVEKTELLVQTSTVDAWSQVIWAFGQCPETMTGYFLYRSSDSEEWITVNGNAVTQEGGSFHTRLIHLEPLTKYVVKAMAVDADGNIEEGNEVSVQTDVTRILPDGNFDEWWKNGKVWYPWNKDGERFWDTGNTGAAIAGDSNAVPSDDTPTGTGKSAMLETKFASVLGIGKLAAGSIFTGSFRKVDGTNGILDFGRPWTERPTKLKGYMKFKTAPINYASNEWKDLMGRPDTCHIYIALTDWTAPFEIRTNPSKRNLFDKDADYIIAYGELLRGNDTNGWEEFEITLNYRSVTKVPGYIQITCAASKYGDYFTGGTGTVLWVDQFSLSYDY